MAPSPSLLLAAVASSTENIHFGPLCYLLPLYDPLRLVNEICMLDQMGNGRLEVGISRGVSPVELGFFGLTPDGARERFNEALEIIEMGLTQTQLSYHGAYYHYENVPLELTPVQKPRPPIWYPTSGIRSVAWVAERGFQTVFLGAPDHVAEQVKLYQEHLPSRLATEEQKVGMLRYVMVAETDEEAMRAADPTYAAHMANLRYLSRSRGSGTRDEVPDTAGAREPNPPDLSGAVQRGWAAVGSPETVSEQIATMVEATGCNYLVFNPLLAATPIEQGLASIELFAEQVMPTLS
jgi:alkanesulfonate monooxygenase SsuD/methylene tetrahydromethanopterin reductase-like flavin-dependent oxidoreductase (luciferase family)